jgi:hypothetical protein
MQCDMLTPCSMLHVPPIGNCVRGTPLLNAQTPNTPPSKPGPYCAANQIAHAAELFGQEDDITLLTLSFVAKEVCHV